MMDGPELYVATGSAEAEHRVRGSRFLAVTSPVSTLEEAAQAREAERRRFHDATHHVFAARTASGESRSDDDGEPSGTGGRPALLAIDASGLRDVVVVVTRWFGGTKLGTGGLGRAYGAVAAEALAATPARRVVRARRLLVTFAYDDTGQVSRALDRCGAVRLQERYGGGVALEVALPETLVQAFTRELAEATGGRATAALQGGGMLLPLDT